MKYPRIDYKEKMNMVYPTLYMLDEGLQTIGILYS